MITADIFRKNQSTSAKSLQWKGDTIAVPHVSDIYTLRIAEGYLNLAEAYAMEDNSQGANQYLRLPRESRIRNYVHTQLYRRKNRWKKSGWNAARSFASKDIAGSI